MKKTLTFALLTLALSSFAQTRFSAGAFSHETNLRDVRTDVLFGYTVRFEKEYTPKKCPFVFMAAGFGLDWKGGRNTYSTGYRLNANFGLSTNCRDGERLFISAGLASYTPIDKSGGLDGELINAGSRFAAGFELKSKWSCGLVANYAFTARRERQVEFFVARQL